MKNIFKVYFSKIMAVTFLHGFAQGLPFALAGSTLTAWMYEEGVDLTVVGIFSLVGIPYSLKFLWAPFMDRFVPNFLDRRRSWMILTQGGLAVLIALMAIMKPAESPAIVALIAVLIAFFSSSQDIVIDAYRTETLKESERGAGSTAVATGWRVGFLVSGAGALVIADYLSWRGVYLLMSGLMAIPILTTLLAPSVKGKAIAPKNLKEAVVEPFMEFFSRRGAIEMILFALLFKFGDQLASSLTTPFLMDLGFSKTEIGGVAKGAGMVATIFGGILGGAIMSVISIRQSLWVFGFAQMAATSSFLVLAMMGKNIWMMAIAFTLENFASGMGIAAYMAFFMSLCNRKFTATQYALLSSLMGVSRSVLVAPAGYLAKTLGWETFYIVAVLAAIPALLLLTRYQRWEFAE